LISLPLAETVGDVAQFKAYARFICVDPTKNRRRFYALTWQAGLWGEATLVRTWGRLGRRGRSLTKAYAGQENAEAEIARLIKRRLQHGYWVMAWQ
jgi:predicted DNA-binding WGR domain protein